MKAAVLTEVKNIEVREVDTPAVTDNEVLVKIKNCGICTLEQRLYRGDMKIYYPIIPGHEASGEVVETGSAVIGAYAPGTRVAVDLVTRCGECYYCRTGQSNMCANRFKKGQKVLGGFGEYITVRASQIYPIPDSMSFRAAAFSEPVACCIRSLKKVDLALAEDVLIVGAGPMGIMHQLTALCMGARVFVSDPDTDRLALAEKLGAYRAIDPTREDPAAVLKEETDGRGADVCIITSPAPAALGNGFDAVGKVGRLNIYTSYNEKLPFPIDANTLHRNEVLVTGSEGRTEQDFLQAVRLIGFGKIDVEPLISETVAFSEIEKGITDAMSTDTYRVLLEHEL